MGGKGGKDEQRNTSLKIKLFLGMLRAVKMQKYIMQMRVKSEKNCNLQKALIREKGKIKVIIVLNYR